MLLTAIPDVQVLNDGGTERLMKILLAIDGSKYSDAAARNLASVFRNQSAEVLVVQVVEPLVFSAPPQMAAGYAPELAQGFKIG